MFMAGGARLVGSDSALLWFHVGRRIPDLSDLHILKKRASANHTADASHPDFQAHGIGLGGSGEWEREVVHALVPSSSFGDEESPA